VATTIGEESLDLYIKLMARRGMIQLPILHHSGVWRDLTFHCGREKGDERTTDLLSRVNSRT
jgi:hypothetical protein